MINEDSGKDLGFYCALGKTVEGCCQDVSYFLKVLTFAGIWRIDWRWELKLKELERPEVVAFKSCHLYS